MSGDNSTGPAADEWCEGCGKVADCKADPEECRNQTEENRRRRQAKLSASFKDIKIGARYQGFTFSDYKPENQAAAKVLATCQRFATTFPERLKAGDNLLMLGNPGTGKNMLAACICQSVAEQGYSAVHTTAIRLLRRIKESWGKGPTLSEQQVIDCFSLPDLLVIDEVGVQYGSETEKLLLFEVINDRYEATKPTIVISNLKLQGVESYLGARIMDRFREGKSALIEFTWESYRRRG